MKEPFDYEAAKKDTVPSKTQPGDYVIPVEIQNQNRGLLAQARQAVDKAGGDPEMYVAGSQRGNYNPQTGDQQFIFKKIKKGVKRLGKNVKRGVKSVGKAAKKVIKSPLGKAALIGGGLFFGLPAAAGALGIGKAGAAGAAAAKAAGGGLLKSSAGWWGGTFGVGAGGAAAKAAGTKGLFGAKTAASMGAQQASGMLGQPAGHYNLPNVGPQGGGSGFWNAAGNLWNGMGGAAQGALVSGAFGAAGGAAEAKMAANMRRDDRKHEVNMENMKTETERENFDDRNRIMGMGRDGEGGVDVDPNMVANWGLGDMSLPRRTHEDLPPPNTPLSDKIRAGLIGGA